MDRPTAISNVTFQSTSISNRSCTPRLAKRPHTNNLKGGHTLVTLPCTVTLRVTDTIQSYELNFHPVPHGLTVSCEHYTLEFVTGARVMSLQLVEASYIYTACPRRNVPDLGRVLLMLKYTDITQNTYVQSWTVTEIMAREKCGLLSGPRTVPVSWQSYPYPSLSVVSYYGNSAHSRSKLLMYFLLGDKALYISAWHSCHVQCLEP